MSDAATTTEKQAPSRGEPITDDGFIVSVNPRTGEELERIPVTPVESMPEVLKRARAAQVIWEKLGFYGRKQALLRVSQYMIDNIDDIAKELARENGKTPYEAVMMELLGSIDFIAWFAKAAKRALKDRKVSLHLNPLARSYISYSPVGVVGVIAPWNYPMLTPISDIAPALAAGNAVIFKPSEFSSGSGRLIERIFKEAQFPTDVVQAVYGGGQLGNALVTSGVNHIGFTGSTATGKKVMAAAAPSLTPVTLELGGKDPAIVRADADLDQAAKGILWGGFSNMGQTCASVERVYVQEAVYKKFREKLLAEANKLHIDANSDLSQFGSMNNAPQASKVNAQIEDAKSKGANLLYQLKTPENDGYYSSPTIVEGLKDGMDLHCEETFGPVIPLYSYSTEDEVIDKANDSPYGLTASIWSRNLGHAERLARSLHAGVVTINDHMITPGFAEAPWGGVKQSGIGRIKSEDALRNYSEQKYVYHDRNLMPHKAWRYPYTEEKLEFVKNLAVALNDVSIGKRVGALFKALPKFIFGFKDDGSKNGGSKADEQGKDAE